jgi:hypothetical protein
VVAAGSQRRIQSSTDRSVIRAARRLPRIRHAPVKAWTDWRDRPSRSDKISGGGAIVAREVLLDPESAGQHRIAIHERFRAGAGTGCTTVTTSLSALGSRMRYPFTRPQVWVETIDA